MRRSNAIRRFRPFCCASGSLRRPRRDDAGRRASVGKTESTGPDTGTGTRARARTPALPLPGAVPRGHRPSRARSPPDVFPAPDSEINSRVPLATIPPELTVTGPTDRCLVIAPPIDPASLHDGRGRVDRPGDLRDPCAVQGSARSRAPGWRGR